MTRRMLRIGFEAAKAVDPSHGGDLHAEQRRDATGRSQVRWVRLAEQPVAEGRGPRDLTRPAERALFDFDAPPPPPPPPPPPRANDAGSEESRQREREVGGHVQGSRKDEAQPIGGSEDLARMDEASIRRSVTKTNLLPLPEIESFIARGGSPGGWLAILAVAGKISGAPPTSDPETRAAYVDGITYAAKGLANCRTAADVIELVEEWRRNRRGLVVIGRDLDQATASRTAREAFRTAMSAGWSHPEDVAPTRKRSWTTILAVPVNYKTGSSQTTWIAHGPAPIDQATAHSKRFRALGPKMDALTFMTGRDEHTTKGAKWRVVMDAATRADQFPEGAWLEIRAALNRSGDAGAGAGDGVAELGRKNRKRPFMWSQAVTGQPERVGGRPVTVADPAAMAKEFGLLTVQPGEAISDEDWRHHVQQCHAALRDLQDILGIPASGIGGVTLTSKSIDARHPLSIAIAARGKGGSVRAHYEPHAVLEADGRPSPIINLTRFSGGGSLAHEWGHFMDHAVALAHSPQDPRKSLPHFCSHANLLGSAIRLPTEVADAFANVMEAIEGPRSRLTREAGTLKAEADRLAGVMHRGGGFKAYFDAKEAHKEAVKRAQEAKATSYFLHAEALSGSNTRASVFDADKTPYFQRPHEMFARAFESWVQDKMTAAGRRNSYLVDGTTELYEDTRSVVGHDGVEVQAQPYPQGDERKTINAAFDRLLTALNQREILKSLGASTRKFQVVA